MNVRTICAVAERVQETPSTVTLRFDYEPAAAPGQFVMIWVPGDDEIPMSLSYTSGRKGVTVKAMGSTSRHILDIPPGALLGIRGPYGNTFALDRKRILVVVGGSGAAVLAPAAEGAIARGARVEVALGATTQRELLFADRFREAGAQVHLSTDDGSAGTKGFVTQLLPGLLDRAEFDALWTCGPEVMMRKAIDAGTRAGVAVFGAVERHMKCAMGLCDACALGPYHVCQDGPVFAGTKLTSIPDFGRFKRESSGRRVPS